MYSEVHFYFITCSVRRIFTLNMCLFSQMDIRPTTDATCTSSSLGLNFWVKLWQPHGRCLSPVWPLGGSLWQRFHEAERDLFFVSSEWREQHQANENSNRNRVSGWTGWAGVITLQSVRPGLVLVSLHSWWTNSTHVAPRQEKQTIKRFSKAFRVWA